MTMGEADKELCEKLLGVYLYIYMYIHCYMLSIIYYIFHSLLDVIYSGFGTMASVGQLLKSYFRFFYLALNRQAALRRRASCDCCLRFPPSNRKECIVSCIASRCEGQQYTIVSCLG